MHGDAPRRRGAATLLPHAYDTTFALGLTDGEKSDLVEYLKSLPSEESGSS